MKKIILAISICFLSASIVSAQWLPGKSCNSTASDITEEAIEHMLNLESPIALGMANAALMVDENCGTAELIKISLAMGGQFGDQKDQLEAYDTDGLSRTEMAWYSLMVDALDNWREARAAKAEEHLEVPLFQFWGAMASENQLESLDAYIESFPEYTSPAYNLISYRYAWGDGVDKDLDKAIEIIEKTITMHDGPNAYDSRAEHYAEAGDFEKALESQLKAMNYAAGPSVYQRNAGIYWRSSNKEALTDSIRAYTKERIHYTMTNDSEGMTKFQPEEMSMIACTSSMNLCETMDEPVENTNYTWNEWDLNNMEVYFNETMDMAITTYTSTGNYTMNSSGDDVDYHTRASEVWQLEGGDWKLVHSNFAPMEDAGGIPKM